LKISNSNIEKKNVFTPYAAISHIYDFIKFKKKTNFIKRTLMLCKVGICCVQCVVCAFDRSINLEIKLSNNMLILFSFVLCETLKKPQSHKFDERWLFPMQGSHFFVFRTKIECFRDKKIWILSYRVWMEWDPCLVCVVHYYWKKCENYEIQSLQVCMSAKVFFYVNKSVKSFHPTHVKW
jgi:hypothetical protein